MPGAGQAMPRFMGRITRRGNDMARLTFREGFDPSGLRLNHFIIYERNGKHFIRPKKRCAGTDELIRQMMEDGLIDSVSGRIPGKWMPDESPSVPL